MIHWWLNCDQLNCDNFWSILFKQRVFGKYYLRNFKEVEDMKQMTKQNKNFAYIKNDKGTRFSKLNKHCHIKKSTTITIIIMIATLSEDGNAQ